MEIREITLEDLPSVYKLGQEAFIQEKSSESFVYSYWSLQQLAQMYEDYPELSLVAIDSETGNLAGFVLGHPNYEGTVDIGYLEWIAIDPHYRGQGLSTRLVEKLLQIYRDRGETRVVTDVKGVNKASMHLFTNKFGFEVKESVSFLLKNL